MAAPLVKLDDVQLAAKLAVDGCAGASRISFDLDNVHGERMSYDMNFKGDLVFDIVGDLLSAMRQVAENDFLEPTDFAVDDTTLSIAWKGSAPATAYGDIVSTLETMAADALGGTIRCEFVGDPAEWVFAAKDLELSSEFQRLMRFVSAENWETEAHAAEVFAELSAN